MSYDVSIRLPKCEHCQQVPPDLEIGNYTGNVGRVYYQALGYSLSELNGIKCAIPKVSLVEAIDKIQSQPEHYAQYVLGNGSWGDLKGAVEFLKALHSGCLGYPEGIICVSS